MNDVALDDLLTAAVDALPGGEVREGQRRMAEGVQEAFASGRHLLVQAGTGTGKSLAYLVPALLADGPVVVATATKALQSQLVTRDVPRLLDAVEPLLGSRPVAALLKGRANYLCLLQLDKSMVEGDQLEVTPSELAGALGRQVLQLRSWAAETETGDRDDVPFVVGPKAWRVVSVSARDCVGAHRCPMGDRCFAERARDAAAEADIVITNHALLAIDVMHGRTVLPEHRLVVVDEAHELVRSATSAFSTELTLAAARHAGRGLDKHVGEEVAGRYETAVSDLASAVDQLRPGRLPQLPSELSVSLRGVQAAALAAAGQLGKAGLDPDEPVLAKAKAQLDHVGDAAGALLAERTDTTRYAELDGGRLRLVVAPLEVGERLAAGLFGDRTVVATSATLVPGGDFGLLAGTWGLHDDELWQGIDVGSPFDYQRQAMLYVAAHLPRPGREGMSAEALAELAELVDAAGGRTLGLFSSWTAARAAAEHLRTTTQRPVLLQDEDTLPRLVRRFREDPQACLVGVRSLWQGVDAPGSTCQLVVIDRIPFSRPDEPLPAARTEAAQEAGRNGFREVRLAEAAILLAQGAGRLIRSGDDRGVVAVLDSRLATATYRDFLVRSLPPMSWSTRRDDVLAALRRIDAAAPPIQPVEGEVVVPDEPGTVDA